MKFKLTLQMEGSFPGSPDIFSTEISEDDYEMLFDRFISSDRRPSQ
jgi:hypothetical protein